MDDVIWMRLMHYFSSREHWRVVNAFQWLPILSDLRSMSLWEGDESRWCILEQVCLQAEIQRERCSGSGQRGNLWKLLKLTVYGCVLVPWLELHLLIKMTHGNFFHPKWHGLMWLWNNLVFFTEVFELCCTIESISGVIKWCLTAWWRRRRFVLHFYLKLCLQTKFHSQTDKEIWIELNQTEVNNNGKWSFFSSHNYYHSSLIAIIFLKGITNQLSLHRIVRLILHTD